MKDKVAMMYDHIRTASDVAPWAIEELRKIIEAYLASGCSGCAFETAEEWEMPCAKCQRNSKDYWRRRK